MSTNKHLRLLASSQDQKQITTQARRLLEHSNQPHLRLVFNREEHFEPLRYAQSTSGRVSSTGTAPELSFSREIASDSPIRPFVDSTLRRYPIDVSQRSAKADCSSTDSELRKVRRASMAVTLPVGNFKSRPMGHLPSGNDPYSGVVAHNDQFAIRRRRLADLVHECGGKHVDFVRALADRIAGRPDLADSVKSFTDTSYVSRALKGKSKTGGKNIGEEPASALEILFAKPKGWMSAESHDQEPWPFGFARTLWDDLSPDEKRDAERQFHTYLSGLHGIRRTTRRKTGS